MRIVDLVDLVAVGINPETKKMENNLSSRAFIILKTSCMKINRNEKFSLL
jgi:hypothetical protein